MQNRGQIIEEGENGQGGTTTNGTIIRKALVISVSDYITSLQALDFCKNDGKDTYELLKSLGYQITDTHRLIGHVRL